MLLYFQENKIVNRTKVYNQIPLKTLKVVKNCYKSKEKNAYFKIKIVENEYIHN